MDIRLEADLHNLDLSTRRARGLLLNRLQKVAKKALAYAESTTTTFSATDVVFKKHYMYSGGNVEVSVSTDSKIWHWLDEGTSERWAVMREPFISKTQPGSIQAQQGVQTYKNGYYTVIRGRQAMQERNIAPRPGIEGRDFSGQIQDVMANEIWDALDDVLRELLG